MKHMKKIVAVVLAMVMMLALGATVFAEAPTTGSISVNPNSGQTYTLYKLFDAEITFQLKNDSETEYEQKAITYKLPEGKTADDLIYTDAGNATHQWFQLNDNGFVEVKNDQVGVDWAKNPNAIAWAKSFGTKVGNSITATSDNDQNVKWDGLGFGYYFVDSTLGSFISVDSANPDMTIEDKNEAPTIDKEITAVTDPDGVTTRNTLGTGDDKTDPGSGANEKAIAQVGDTVSYKITVKAKAGAENYIVTDTLSTAFTAPAANDVTVEGLTKTDDYTVEVTGQVIKVTFKKAYLDTITGDKDIVIKYSAVLNNNAVIGVNGNDNTAVLEWGHKETRDTSSDSAKVYTAQISITKEDNEHSALSGAGFVIKNADDKYYKLNNSAVTWVTDIDDADEHTSGADGSVNAFTGLGAGTYTLVEKTVPAGFNKAADKTIAISGDNYTDTNLIKSETVINQKGIVLPSTGGMGTTIFYIVGGILVVGAGVLLVTRKRMDGQKK